jgi:hypothetical protein
MMTDVVSLRLCLKMLRIDAHLVLATMMYIPSVWNITYEVEIKHLMSRHVAENTTAHSVCHRRI